MSKQKERGAVSRWLEQKYLEWVAQEGRRRSLTEFAAYLNVPQPQLSHYMNGTRIPRGENLDRIAAVLGEDVYEVAQVRSYDKGLRKIIEVWNQLSPEEQNELIKRAAEDVKNKKNR